MNPMNTANAYKNQQILTASPAQLTLLLYNGAVRFANESILALEKGDIPKSYEANLRAQDIVREFMRTLDMKYELSQTWAQLYEFIEHSLIQGNIKKDVGQIRQAKEMLEEMREAWQEAMKQTQVARAGAR